MSKLKLSPPLKVMVLTQKFGNKNDLYNEFGGYHTGLDYRAPHGTPIYASHDGLAQYQVDGRGGHGVIVISTEKFEHDHGKTLIKTVYWHMPDPLKYPDLASPLADKTGLTPVKRGDLIGYADNSGFSTGSHLHYALKPVLKLSGGVYQTINAVPPLYGNIDPAPYLPERHHGTPHRFYKNLKYLDKGPEVEWLQRALHGLGYYGHKIDGEYGRITKIAVLAFQINDGVIRYPLQSNYGFWFGPMSRRKLNDLAPSNYQPCLTVNRTLKKGMKGEEVKSLQRLLADLEYYDEDIDGIFGFFTEKAVKTFQSDSGLKVDGIVGPITTATLLDYCKKDE